MAGVLEGCVVFNKILMKKSIVKMIHFPWHRLSLEFRAIFGLFTYMSQYILSLSPSLYVSFSVLI